MRWNRGLAIVLAMASLWTGGVKAGLEEYIKKPDAAFAWTHEGTKEVGKHTIHSLKVTSQEWKGIKWSHSVSLIVPPDDLYPDAAVLWICGGSIGDGPKDGDIALGLVLARAAKTKVIILPQVPAQPLLGDKQEDTLIAETFVRYLDTKDEEWPLLFPMAKSAVKTMDAVQAFAKEKLKPIDRFVVSGGSKRGWTTWLTGAVDPRVKGIVPMVIPTLNFKAQDAHQIENYGAYSEQIGDYVARGLMDKFEEPARARLWHMVDPLSYRDKLTMPKLQVNGTNDPYWTLDSMNLYWDDLKGPKYVVYLPDAGHGLDKNRSYATNGVGAMVHHVIGGKPLPELTWKHGDTDAGALTLSVTSDIVPKSAKLWTATSDTPDFRKSKWSSEPLAVGKAMTGQVNRPAKGNVALFADLEFEIEGLSYHLSTQIRQTNLKPNAQ